MENATKALLMAGGVLISILVITFMVMVLRSAGQFSSSYDNQISENELVKFNSQFEAYAKDDNSFFDIITASNLAWDINKKNGYDIQNGVTINVLINKGNQKGNYTIIIDSSLPKNYFNKDDDTIYMYDLVSEYSETKDGIETIEYKYLFECTNISYNEVTGKVNKMSFEVKQN